MIPIEVKDQITNDDITKELIGNYGAIRLDLPFCNCGNMAKPCSDSRNRMCNRTTAPTEAGVYTKLDRDKPILDLGGNPITVTDEMLTELSNRLNYHNDLMNVRIEELRLWILQNPTASNLPEKIKNLEILRLFYEELCFMIS